MRRKEKLAEERVSRILCPTSPAVEPAKAGGDHSSRSRIAPGLEQPTRGSETPLLRACVIRAGPALPSYLALLHAGFSVPRMLPPGRWALTPPFHPCQMRLTGRGGPLVLPRACRRGASITGGLFSVALSVAAPQPRAFTRHRAQPPGVTRRVALAPPALASVRRSESGLSSRPGLLHWDRRSPGSSASAIIGCISRSINSLLNYAAALRASSSKRLMN